MRCSYCGSPNNRNPDVLSMRRDFVNCRLSLARPLDWISQHAIPTLSSCYIRLQHKTLSVCTQQSVEWTRSDVDLTASKVVSARKVQLNYHILPAAHERGNWDRFYPQSPEYEWSKDQAAGPDLETLADTHKISKRICCFA